MQLTMTSYPDLTEAYIFMHAILRLCQGCIDKEAGQYALTCRPESVEDAVDKYAGISTPTGSCMENQKGR